MCLSSPQKLKSMVTDILGNGDGELISVALMLERRAPGERGLGRLDLCGIVSGIAVSRFVRINGADFN